MSTGGPKIDSGENCFPLKVANQLASYYRKRGSASYIVREVQSVRERERESETEVVRRK